MSEVEVNWIDGNGKYREWTGDVMAAVAFRLLEDELRKYDAEEACVYMLHKNEDFSRYTHTGNNEYIPGMEDVIIEQHTKQAGGIGASQREKYKNVIAAREAERLLRRLEEYKMEQKCS